MAEMGSGQIFELVPGQSFTLTVDFSNTGNIVASFQVTAWVNWLGGEGPGSAGEFAKGEWAENVPPTPLSGASVRTVLTLTAPNDARLIGKSYPIRFAIWSIENGAVKDLITPVAECGGVSFPDPVVAAAIGWCGVST